MAVQTTANKKRDLLPMRRKRPESLTEREQEILQLIWSGLKNKEIAERLAISVKTVDTHRGHVLKKLKLRNNSDITRFAIQHGYIHC